MMERQERKEGGREGERGLPDVDDDLQNGAKDEG